MNIKHLLGNIVEARDTITKSVGVAEKLKLSAKKSVKAICQRISKGKSSS